VPCLASMSCLLSISSLVSGFEAAAAADAWAYSFLSSLTLSAYLKVLSVCSQQLLPGETLAIIVVLLFPVNESFNT